MGQISAEPGSGDIPEQFTYLGGPQDNLARKAAIQLSVARIAAGVIWAVIALGLAAGGIAELTIGIVAGAVLCFVIAALVGWYDYRIWKPKARRSW